MNKLVIFLLLLSMPLTAASEELKITPVDKGQPAPHSGVLLDSESAAKIIVDKKVSEERCEIQKEAAVNRGKAECEYRSSLLEAEKQAEKKKLEILLSSQEKENERLHRALEETDSINGVWWFLTGTITGIVTSVAIFYAAVKTAE